MKVMLETRCGCKRTVDVEVLTPRIVVPMWPSEVFNSAREAERAFVEHRVFEHDSSVDGIHLYRERA